MLILVKVMIENRLVRKKNVGISAFNEENLILMAKI